MPIGRIVPIYAHYLFGLRKFLSKTLSLAECYALARKRVEERNTNFLARLEMIYANPQNPYHRLLRHAGCEFGDIESLLDRYGLEATLEKLSEAGVYITVEEYKGRKPVERNNLSFTVRPEDFDNPYLSPSFQLSSGGTRDPGNRSLQDFGQLTDEAASEGVSFDNLGLNVASYGLWHNSMKRMLTAAKREQPPEKWFFLLASHRNKLATYYAVAVGRLLGYPLPWPEQLIPQQAHRVAEWLAQRKAHAPRAALWAGASSAVRVCAAARERGIDISGSHFISASEPLTQAREREIRAAGCTATATYACTESGHVAFGCRNSVSDDMHLLKGHVAIVQKERALTSAGITINAFQITSLRPLSPKIMLNMENGDYGYLETRRCGCSLDSLGLTDHVGQIRSFEKLTSEGMRFFAGELARIVEEFLPARFGGSPLDYQAVEEEGNNGFGRLTLLISPKVGEVDEDVVIKAVLDKLSRGGGTNRRMARMWEQAGTVRVRREEPHPTQRGKVFPFQVQVTARSERQKRFTAESAEGLSLRSPR